MWGGSTISGSAGGTGFLTSTTFIDGQYGPSSNFTAFATTSSNVKIVSLDYSIPAWQSVTNLVISIYNSSNTLLATSSTNTTRNNSTGSPISIANAFNYTIATAGTYYIRASAGFGNIGGDNPAYPITEATGTVNITGHASGGYRCFNDIQFTKGGGSSTAPTPVTTTLGTTNYTVTQTVSGCVSPTATIAVNVNGNVGTPTAITVSAGSQPTCQLTNGTTTTTYATTATNNTGFTWSLSNAAAGSINSSGVMTWANGFSGSVNIRVVANGCNGPSPQVSRTVSITPAAATPTAITGTPPTCQLTNATTTTTFATTSTNSTGFNWTVSNPAAGTINSSGVMTWANGFSGSVIIGVTATGCNGASAQTTRTINITPAVSTPVFSLGSTSSRCQAGETVVYTATAANANTITYSLNSASITAGNSIVSSTGAVTFVAGYTGTSVITVTASGCNGSLSATHTVTTNTQPSVSATTTLTCVGGSTGSITATGSGGATPYTYNINGGAYQSSGTFSGLSAGNYTINVSSSTGCIASTTATVSPFATSSDDQNTAGTNTWIGHVYDGTNFNDYIGSYAEAETFNQTFGGAATCFNVTSGSTTSSIHTETFTAKYRMNSTKNGLYIVDLGSDDGSRLTVDGALIYNNWNAQSYGSRPRVLFKLNGNSSLLYEYFENGGDNRLTFQNLTLVLSNALTSNTSQNICIGNTGNIISGDVYGTLPTGISFSGTGYQWSYSTTPGGTRTDIAGATGAEFTPSTSAAPFNAAGTYYLYRNATLSSTNNVSPNPYNVTHESNAAVVTISAMPSAVISYAGSPYCSNSGTAEVTITGTTGGTFSSTSGLSLNASTGSVTLASSTPGTYTVTYTMINSGCTVTTTAAITVTAAAAGTTISYAGTPYCSSAGTATVSINGVTGGTFSAASGLSINPSTGAVDLAASTAGTYTVTYTVAATGGCPAFSTTTSIRVTTQPYATGYYLGNPYCTNFGIAYPTGSSAGASGTLSASGGLTINPSNGVVDLASGAPGSYTITYTVPASGGCALYTTTYELIIKASPSATISYTGSPYCKNNTSTATVTHTGTTGGTYSSTTGLSINATTGEVNVTASTPGIYTVTYRIAAASSCAAFTTTTTINIQEIGWWTGSTSTNWNDASNWGCNTIPTVSTDVTIPARPNQPVITSGTGAARNINIRTGASITVNSSLALAGTITNSGSITASNGTIEMRGTSAQVIPAALFSANTVDNLIIGNPSGVSLAGTLRLTNTLSFGNVSNSVFSTGGFLTLGSTATRTAHVADITNNGASSGNVINGSVTVERYMTARRSFRFFTAPVNSSGSIKANWMENTNNAYSYVNNNPVPGYGTHITGSGGATNGFDATVTNNSSLYTFNNLTQTWSAVGSTSGSTSVGTPYRFMVRGSRSADLNSNDANPSVTTIRTNGTLFTGTAILTKPGGGGTAGFPELNTNSNTYNLVANPYAAAIDWRKLPKNDLSRTIYYYDPTIQGTNGRGSYVSYNDVIPAVSNGSSNLNNNIQSGQAFFVQTNGPNPSLSFREQDKVNTQRTVFRPAEELPNISVKLLLPAQENSGQAADGFVAYFSNDFDSSIADEDSYKFTNLDENIGILRNGKTLSIEGRKPVTVADTLPIKMWQLTQSSYLLQISIVNFADNVSTYLEDAYLKVKTVVNNNTTTKIPFSIVSDPASFASDRFRIVFETFATLPVQLTNMKAVEKNKGVQVEWTAESEMSMDSYEVQRSNNALQFVTVANQPATGNTGTAVHYHSFDANPADGDNYYRIKSIDKSGEIKFSQVAKVNITVAGTDISFTASQGSANSLRLNFKNTEKGAYAIKVVNTAGQTVHKSSVSHTGGTANHIIQLNNPVASGAYQVQVSNSGKRQTVTILLQ